MRFTITPLGAKGGRPVGAVVADIVKYLQQGQRDPTAEAPSPGGGPGPGSPPAGDPGEAGNAGSEPSRYYADAGEAPGRWLGQGAAGMGLAGTVASDDFRRVLGGRHPVTGERLISARGAAGRVDELGAGSAAAYASDGEPLYDLADVATVLGWTRGDAAEAAADGQRMAAARLFAVLAGAGTGPGDAPGPTGTSTGEDSGPSGTGTALVPVLGPDGSILVRESELTRVEALVSESRSGPLQAGTADPGEFLNAAEAARLIGTSRSYVARLCRAWEEHRDEITAGAGTDKPSRRAYIEATQSESGEWQIRHEDLAAYADRRRQPTVRVGYDVTATTEKSLSVLALLGGGEVRGEVLAAVEAANDCGMRWVEHNTARARAGKQIVAVQGWTVASFQHLTSRHLDPFIHHHNVVANTVLDEHGVRRALDARQLFQRVSAGSAVATAQLRWELTRRLGVRFRRARHGGWEIHGISDEVIDEFSSRTREIQDTISELEDALGRTTTLAEFRDVVAGTRPAKRSTSEDRLLATWWDGARAHGLDHATLDGLTGQGRIAVMSAPRRARVLDALALAVVQERSVFTRTDVLTTLADLPDPDGLGDVPVVIPGPVLEDLTDEFLVSGRAVRLGASSGRRDHLTRRDGTTIDVGGGKEPEYSTTEILAKQARTLRTYRDGTGARAGIVPPTVLAAALDRFPDLDPEQRRMVAMFCTSGDTAQSGVGRAGTGKTFAMRAAVAAWTDAGYRVVGAAVKADAARHLTKDCGIPAEPLAWYLHRLDDPERSPLAGGRTVLIVDEASTISDRDLDTLLSAARRDRATVRFIGDPAQHSSVNAGGLWRYITQHHALRTPQLTQVRRVRHDGDRKAAEALRSGRADVALAALEAAGHLHIVEDDRALFVEMLTRWTQARQAGAGHPMVDRRNDQRLILNRLARVMRRHAGELGDVEIGAAHGRRFAVGDEVAARMGDRTLHPAGQRDHYLRNGAHGVVTAVLPGDTPTGDRLVIDFDGLGTITVPRSFFDEHTKFDRTDVGIDHAYAITSYAVEGLTFDESSSHVDPRSTRPEVYVDITRGRYANHVYVTRGDDALAGERLPAVPPPAVEQQLKDRLDGPPGEPVAVELDPDAGRAALARWTDPAAAGPLDENQWVARAVANPDPGLVARLGGVPAEVHLLGRYQDLLADMARYRHRWRPRPDRAGPWSWALGRPVDHRDAAAARDLLTSQIADYTADLCSRHLDGRTLTPDDYDAIERVTAHGWLDRIDFELVRTDAASGRPLDEILRLAMSRPDPGIAQEAAGVG